jgi:hypothetical protein
VKHVIVIVTIHINGENVLAVGESLSRPVLVLCPVHAHIRGYSILLLPLGKDIVIGSGRVESLQHSLS